MTTPATPWPARLAEGVLIGIFAALPLATSVHELAMGVGLAIALVTPHRGRMLTAPWGRAVLAVAAVWVLLVPASGDVREGLGHAWLLAPLLAVPALLALLPEADRAAAIARVTSVGLAAACLAAAWAVGQRAFGLVGTAGLSHHLSLAYALLPPLGVAVATRRRGIAVLLAAGVFATGSAGALVALAVTTIGAWARRPSLAAAVGLPLTVALLATAANGEELRQRAVLWTGGLAVAEAGATGPGGYRAASALAYDRLVDGFWFPNHAHDSGIQLLAVLGPAGLVATALLCVVLLGRAHVGAAAGLAGVLVGGLTQDVLGDLEVARAVWAWCALFGATALASPPALVTATSREPDAARGY